MIRHYFTLFHVANELNERLQGLFIEDCFSQQENVLIINFTDSTSHIFLECDFSHKNGGIYLREPFGRSRSKSKNVFKELIGQTVHSVQISPNERIISIECTDYLLHFTLFGSSKNTPYACINGNAIITDENLKIIDTFISSSLFKNTYFASSTSHLIQLKEQNPNYTVSKALAACNLFLWKLYADSVCNQAGIAKETLLSSLTENQLHNLEQVAMDYCDNCYNSNTFYYISKQDILNNLELVPPYLQNEFGAILVLSPKIVFGESWNSTLVSSTSISEIIRKVAINSSIINSATQKQHSEKQKLINELERAERTLSFIRDDQISATKQKELTVFGEILLSQTPNLLHQNGQSSFNTTNWDEINITIPLKPELTLAQNAQLFFEKARKSRQMLIIRKEREKKVLEKITELERKIIELESIEVTNSDSASKLRKQVTSGQPETVNSKFRVFELGNSWKLYVGKSAENNDELTMKFAKSQDVWLHARGVSGSHCILRGSLPNPPKDILEKSAQIAAYFSKARNSKYVPVIYTHRKFVRKPKKSAVGAVTLDREEIIFVTPSLPT